MWYKGKYCGGIVVRCSQYQGCKKKLITESTSAQIRFMNNTDVLGAMTGSTAAVSRFTWGRTSDSVSSNGFQCNGTGSVYALTVIILIIIITLLLAVMYFM